MTGFIPARSAPFHKVTPSTRGGEGIPYGTGYTGYKIRLIQLILSNFNMIKNISVSIKKGRADVRPFSVYRRGKVNYIMAKAMAMLTGTAQERFEAQYLPAPAAPLQFAVIFAAVLIRPVPLPGPHLKFCSSQLRCL